MLQCVNYYQPITAFSAADFIKRVLIVGYAEKDWQKFSKSQLATEGTEENDHKATFANLVERVLVVGYAEEDRYTSS